MATATAREWGYAAMGGNSLVNGSGTGALAGPGRGHVPRGAMEAAVGVAPADTTNSRCVYILFIRYVYKRVFICIYIHIYINMVLPVCEYIFIYNDDDDYILIG